MAILKAEVSGRIAAVFLIALLLPAVQLQALDPGTDTQQYQLDAWLTEEGLPSTGVWAIVQTADGYLWHASYRRAQDSGQAAPRRYRQDRRHRSV